MQSCITDHMIIKSKDFWESCAFESVASELQIKQKRRSERKELFESSKDKFIVFSQLASLAHNMLIFNYSNVEIKDIITRYARFFSLPED